MLEVRDFYPPKYWAFIVTSEGLSVFPVYRGNCGCRLWTFETLGM